MRAFPLLLIALVSCPAMVVADVAFLETAGGLGIDHAWDGSFSEVPAVGNNHGGGVALEDFDRDGDLDVFLSRARPNPLEIYRNDGASFADVTGEMGVGNVGTAKQIVLADLDNDGWRDLVVAPWARATRIFQNVGGTFVDRTQDANLGQVVTSDWPLATGAALGDYDRDGDLDLYLSLWHAAVGPKSANVLYRNDGNFTFADVTAEAGVGSTKKSFQPVFAHLNDDLWPDLVVAQDKGGGMTHYRNDGDGSFTVLADGRDVNISGMTGRVATQPEEQPTGYVDGMGVAVGDVDNDGDQDLYVTNISTGNVMYRNDGGDNFVEVADASSTKSLRIGWGADFFDCDNDGLLDLYVACFGGPNNINRLYHNQGGFLFNDVASVSGVNDDNNGYGVATGDIDRDGRVDVILTNANITGTPEPTRLFLNQSQPVNNWVRVRLAGSSSNRDGVGARIQVTTDDPPAKALVTQMREVFAGISYLSHSSITRHFGLGSATRIEEIRVVWPSGTVDVIGPIETVNREFLIEEGSGQAVAAAVQSFDASASDSGVRVAWNVLGGDDVALERIVGDRIERLLTGLPAQGEWIDEASAQAARYRLLDWRSETELASASVPATLTLAMLGTPHPNPFNPRVQIEVHLPQARANDLAVLTVFDARGRVVRDLHRGPLAAGTTSFTWDGLDANGRPVASGVYSARLTMEGLRRSTTMTLVR